MMRRFIRWLVPARKPVDVTLRLDSRRTTLSREEVEQVLDSLGQVIDR